MASDVKTDRRYTKDHEWAKATGSEVEVGITAYAVEQLGDITLVNLDVKVGDTIAKEAPFGTIESVKTLSDLFSPIAGKITRINTELDKTPELVNGDCYGAWMIAIEASDMKEVEALLDPAAYSKLIEGQ